LLDVLLLLDLPLLLEDFAIILEGILHFEQQYITGPSFVKWMGTVLDEVGCFATYIPQTGHFGFVVLVVDLVVDDLDGGGDDGFVCGEPASAMPIISETRASTPPVRTIHLFMRTPPGCSVARLGLRAQVEYCFRGSLSHKGEQKSSCF
jgi:hypothetical protein